MNTTTITTLPGKLSPMKRDEYDADKSRLRATSLKDLVIPEQGPRAYYLKHVLGIRDEPGDGLRLGIIFHEWLLEGITKPIGWTPWVSCPITRNARHKAYQEFLAENPGKHILSTQEDRELRSWREGVFRNRQARQILEMPRHEEQVVLGCEEVEFVDDEGEVLKVAVPTKAAIDAMPFARPPGFRNPTRFCLKTDAAVTGWDNTVFRHGYHTQSAWYERVVHSIPEFADTPWSFAHIVAEKKSPYYCYVRPLSDAALNLGNKDCELALERYCQCKRREELGIDPLDAWPDLLEAKQSDPLMPPNWANEAYGNRHSQPLTSSEPVAYEEETYGHAIPATAADYYRELARSAG